MAPAHLSHLIRRPPCALAGALALVSAWLTPAAARASQIDAAAAEALFHEARALVEKGRIGEACTKFEESQRLDPGVGTLLNLGDCYERASRFASAWVAYRDAAAAARRGGQHDQAEDAEALAKDAEPKLHYLRIEVPSSSDLRDLEVTRGAQSVRRPQWGVAIPVDAGRYEIVASAPGYVAWRVVADVSGAPRVVLVQVPSLTRALSAPAATTEPEATSWRPLALSIGGLGVAGVAVGAGAGIAAINLDRRACRSGCSDDRCPTREGADLTTEAQGWAFASTVFVASGVTLAAAGVVLWVASPKERARRTVALYVSPAAGGASLGFGGVWR